MFKWTLKGAIYGSIIALGLRVARVHRRIRWSTYLAMGAGFGTGLAYQRSQDNMQRWVELHRRKDRDGLPHVVEESVDLDKIAKLEMKVLAHSGIPFDQFKIYNVHIDSNGNYIRTIEVGDPKNQKIVIIHGYGASSMNFYKVIKPLSENYHLILIDIIGMGGSSRPLFNFTDPSKIDEFLVDWLERWRLKMENLDNFILAGHSFGGYVSGLYAIKYP